MNKRRSSLGLFSQEMRRQTARSTVATNLIYSLLMGLFSKEKRCQTACSTVATNLIYSLFITHYSLLSALKKGVFSPNLPEVDFREKGLFSVGSLLITH